MRPSLAEQLPPAADQGFADLAVLLGHAPTTPIVLAAPWPGAPQTPAGSGRLDRPPRVNGSCLPPPSPVRASQEGQAEAAGRADSGHRLPPPPDQEPPRQVPRRAARSDRADRRAPRPRPLRAADRVGEERRLLRRHRDAARARRRADDPRLAADRADAQPARGRRVARASTPPPSTPPTARTGRRRSTRSRTARSTCCCSAPSGSPIPTSAATSSPS